VSVGSPIVLRALSLCISVLLVFCSLRLLRRFGGIGPILLLVGSGVFLIASIFDIALALLMPYVLSHHGTAFVQSFWGTCTPNPWVRHTQNVLPMLGIVCLFIGFVWFSLRATRHI
jgi:hypothetical protein